MKMFPQFQFIKNLIERFSTTLYKKNTLNMFLKYLLITFSF